MRIRSLVVIALIALVVAALTIYWTMSQPTVRVRVTTTTSLYATGLLDYLAAAFEKEHPGVHLDFIPVGSGEALRRAAQGDACLVLVHAPSLEDRYIREGVLVDGTIFAYNYFVIVGPADDPAGVQKASSAVDAFRRIFEAGEKGMAVFVSRGDMSGTHVRELAIWRLIGLDPHGKKWYLEVGAGMADTLVRANELHAYTLSDIGTFLKLKKDGRIPYLELLYTNSTELINVYSAYLVNGCSGAEWKAARKFIHFLATEAQELIARYGVEEYGHSLFYPAAGRMEELKKAWSMLANLKP